MMERYRSVPWLNLGNQTFSMRVENVIETSHWNYWFPTFGRGALLPLSRHTCVSRHTGWETLA